ncbi:MAG TPA: FAD-dependent oxidoreductase [Steroidobacteraceae bacterium]
MAAPLTRRRLLNLIGLTAGSAAAYQAAMGLGLAPAGAAESLPDIVALGAQKRRVLILGAGIAGLTAAYELSRKGYECLILEASQRVGGRNLTLRHGDVVDEIDQPQVCHFDAHPDLYMNAGPARISALHTSVLGYCRDFGVALEPFVNQNRNAWVQDEAIAAGRPVRVRECMADTRGFLAELTAKAYHSGRLDLPVEQSDAENVLEFLRIFGGLDADNRYDPQLRAVLRTDTTLPLPLREAHGLSELMRIHLWTQLINIEEAPDQAPTMLTPVGGMDNLVRGFQKQLAPVRTGCQVRSIMLREKQVEVTFEGPKGLQSETGDFCLNGIPAHLMRGVAHNFDPAYAQAFDSLEPGNLIKIGLQMRERFWEAEQIYGGMSWTTQDITQIWYPGHGIHGAKGVVLGAYVFGGEAAQRFEQLTAAQRLAAAVAQAGKVHPRYGEYVENGVSVVWRRMRYLQGCAPLWTAAGRSEYFATLRAAHGRHYMIGDQVSFASGWQQGAMDSAWAAVRDIDARVRAEIA